MAYHVDTDYLDAPGDWSLSVVSGMELVAGARDKNEVREIDNCDVGRPQALDEKREAFPRDISGLEIEAPGY